jgi:transcription elongation GreA/GreB family factor
MLSVHSPVARALLGHEAGDDVEVELPAGRRSYDVIEVRRTAP